MLPTELIRPVESKLPLATLPTTLSPDALEKVATAVGVIAPEAVVNTCTFVALLVSVNASAAVISNRPVDKLPNCKSPLLNPRAVNWARVSPDCVCVGVAPVPPAVRPVNATYDPVPNASCKILVLLASAPEICISTPATVLLPVMGYIAVCGVASMVNSQSGLFVPTARLAPVILPVAEIIPAVRRLPPWILPVTVATPAVTRLPPVMFALTETVVPVSVVAFTLAPPSTLPPVILPVALICPTVRRLPP